MPRSAQNALQDRPPIKGAALQDRATAANNGVWFRVDGVTPWSITVSGSFGGTIRILVANQTPKPDDTDNNFPQIDADITQPTALHIEGSYTWVKAYVPTLTIGTVSVHLNVG